MSDIMQYTLSLNDQMSANLQKIGVNSTNALNKFAALQLQTKKTTQLMKDMGGSIGALRERLNLLRNEKEWIPANQINSLRKYNSEIKNLEKEILKLDTINGSKFKTNLKSAFSNLPFSNLITNPVAIAGAALFGAGNMALHFDEGMAKINTTAQLSSDNLGVLKKQLISIGTDTGANLSEVPDAFEKILSQVNDVPTSLELLKASLMGSKAGFTDQTTVANALAQTLSLVGKENTNAAEVMDTLFAAKRVGAGEFSDFANYVPGLIASGQALGVGFKETTGLFAYMTGKGQDAEKSATLIQNAFTALGKSEITSGLAKKIGKNTVFNKDGSMKQIDEIMASVGTKLASFGTNDKAKLKFLESIGLKDQEAKRAFMIMSSDAQKLKESISATTNAQGEAKKAFEKSMNPMQRMQMLWSKIQGIGISLGGVISGVLGPVFSALNFILTPIAVLFNDFFNALSAGNPIIIAIAGAIGILAVAMNLATIKQWALNIAQWASPTTWIIMGIIALIAVIYYLITSISGWGKAWEHVVQGAKYLWGSYIEFVKANFNLMIQSIMIGIGKIQLGWYKFKEAVGMGDSKANQVIIAKISEDIEQRKQSIKDGYQKMAATALKAKNEFEKAGGSLKWNNKSMSDVTGGLKEKLGITPPAVPGVDPNATDLGGDDKNKDKTQINEAIATGGTKHNYITITLGNMVETINVSGRDFKEGVNQMETQVQDAMMRILGMAVTVGN